jgi:hypothetical protein
MSDFNWCHGTECHTRKTQDRVKGSKGSKVLRTRRISLSNEYIRDSIHSYFCSQSCLYDFINTHKERVVAIQPRREPLETQIKDPKKVTETNSYNNYSWTRTQIKTRVDND